MNTSVTDFTDVLTNPNVAKLITNGVLVIGSYVLTITEYNVVGQVLASTDAPVEIELAGTISLINEDGSVSPIRHIALSNPSAPGQAYHALVDRFKQHIFQHKNRGND